MKADLDVVHSDLGSPDLYLANGSRIKGILIKDIVIGDANRASETHLTFKSSTELDVGDTITNRREGTAWEVIQATSVSGLYSYMLRLSS